MDKQTLKQMEARGAEHARAGKQCTPYDCQALDAELFGIARAAGNGNATAAARAYSQLRGAFNAGWQAEYFRLTCATA